MEKKYLLEKEEIITQSDENVITLTNLRLRYSQSEFNKAHIVSILLQHISSIEVHYSNQIFYLFIGICFTLFGIGTALNNMADYGLVVIVAGLLLIAMFFSSKKYFITISSDGGSKINFHAKGMKKDAVLDFINRVEKAINERVITIRYIQN